MLKKENMQYKHKHNTQGTLDKIEEEKDGEDI